jgi:hypothetical protein
MGFNQRYVGNVLQIQKELDEYGLDEFVRIYTKYDSLTGDSESIDFIESIVKKYYNEKYIISNSNINTTK